MKKIDYRKRNAKLYDILVGSHTVYSVFDLEKPLTSFGFEKNNQIRDSEDFLCTFASQAVSEASLSEFDSIQCTLGGWSIRHDGIAILKVEATDLTSFDLYFELTAANVLEVETNIGKEKLLGGKLYRLRYTNRSNSATINAVLPFNEDKKNIQYLIFKKVTAATSSDDSDNKNSKNQSNENNLRG